MYQPDVQTIVKPVATGMRTGKPKGDDIPAEDNARNNIIINGDGGTDEQTDSASDELITTVPLTLPARLVGHGATVPFGTHMRRRRARGVSNGLPQQAADPTMHFNFRYTTDGDGSTTVKISDLARAMVAAATGDSFRYMFRTIKINRVTVRAATGTIGGTAAVKLLFLGSNTNEITHMDQTMRVGHNACVSLRPPRFSLASFWHDVTSATDNEVQIFRTQTNTEGSGESFVDVSLSVVFDASRYITYTMQDNNLSGLNPGGLYYGNLGGSSEQVVWTPVGRKALGV